MDTYNCQLELKYLSYSAKEEHYINVVMSRNNGGIIHNMLMAPQYLSKALSNVMEMGWKWRERKKYTITRKEDGTKDRREKKSCC